MPTHIIEKQKLIEKHVERNTVQKWGTQS